MCGIAGYSLSPSSSVDRTRAAQALLAAIAERGADAVGYAFRSPEGRRLRAQAAHRRQRGARPDRRSRPTRDQVLLHVRDYTKGHPRIAANNHPVRHGAVVGVHNGTILNDDELHGPPRLRARRARNDGRLRGDLRRRRGDRLERHAAFEEFRGSMAAAWLDERQP